MGLKPIKSWDSEPKGWLEEPASNVEPKADEATAAESETSKLASWDLFPSSDSKDLASIVAADLASAASTQTSELASMDIDPSPEKLVEEATEGVGTIATKDPVVGVDLAQNVSITETLEDAANNPINSEPAILAISDPSDDVVEGQDVLDLTFRIMQLYNLPYDLTRAFELVCSADAIRVTRQDLENTVKLLKHRLQSVDSNEVLTNNAIPLEMSPDWIIDILSLKFLYGKCVDSILTYAQTGDAKLLESAIRSLEYRLGLMYAEENQ